MNAIEFEEQTAVYAEKQDEYQSLPSHVGNDIVTCLMELDTDELIEVVKNREVWIRRLTFYNPVQPTKISITKPEFPVDVKGFECNPYLWPSKGDVTGVVLFRFVLNIAEIKEIKQSKCFWLSTVIFKSSLQPIGLNAIND